MALTDEQNALLAQHYTASELAKLSEAEREALVADGDEDLALLNRKVVDDEDKSKGAVVKTEEELAAEAAAVEESEAAAKSKTEADAAAATKAAEEAAASAGQEKEERLPFAPKYQAEPVEEYESKMATLDKKYQDGELQLPEYNKQRDELVRAQLKAEISSEQTAQIEDQLWKRAQEDFFEEHPEYSSRMRSAALDVAVKELANDAANSDKTYRWFLKEAHKQVQAELGGKVEEKSATPAADAAKPTQPAAPARKPDLALVPPTLAKVPAADTGVQTAGEFDYLDKLEGIAHERALARLSPEQQERYLAA